MSGFFAEISELRGGVGSVKICIYPPLGDTLDTPIIIEVQHLSHRIDTHRFELFKSRFVRSAVGPSEYREPGSSNGPER